MWSHMVGMGSHGDRDGAFTMLRALSLCWMSPAAFCSACSAMPWACRASSSACRTASAVPRTPSARDLWPDGKASA